MKKKKRPSPDFMKKQWHKARPQLTKQIDEHQRNLAALTTLTIDTFEQVNDMFDYEIATLQSKIIQEKKNERTLQT